jgi:hypothetical protein
MIATRITCLIYMIYIWKHYKPFYPCNTCGMWLLFIAFQVRDEGDEWQGIVSKSRVGDGDIKGWTLILGMHGMSRVGALWCLLMQA